MLWIHVLLKSNMPAILYRNKTPLINDAVDNAIIEIFMTSFLRMKRVVHGINIIPPNNKKNVWIGYWKFNPIKNNITAAIRFIEPQIRKPFVIYFPA